VVWDAITSCYGGRTNAKTVAGEIARNNCSSKDFLDPRSEDSVGGRPTILEKEQRATRVSPHCQVCQNSLKGTKREASPANIDKAAFPKVVSLGVFNPHSQAGGVGIKGY